jgi:hypothetical protein
MRQQSPVCEMQLHHTMRRLVSTYSRANECMDVCICARACSTIRKWYGLDSGRTFRSSQSPCNYSHVAVIHPLAELSRWFSLHCWTGSGLDMSLSQSGYLLMSGDISKCKWSKDICHSVFGRYCLFAPLDLRRHARYLRTSGSFHQKLVSGVNVAYLWMESLIHNLKYRFLLCILNITTAC